MNTLYGIVWFIGICIAICAGVVFVAWFMKSYQDKRMKDISKPEEGVSRR